MSYTPFLFNSGVSLKKMNEKTDPVQSRVNYPKLAKMAIFKPPFFNEKQSQVNIFSMTTAPGQAQDNSTCWMILKKFRQKWLVKKSKFDWNKKTTPSANIPLLSYRKSEQS